MRSTWSFFAPGRVLFGCGAVQEAGASTRRLGVSRLFVVTDAILDRVGLVAKVVAPLRSAGLTVEVFTGGEPEPSFACADAAIAAASQFRPDGIIGLGGGSNMDLAKITAGVVTHGGHYSEYFHFDNLPGPVLPLVCIPTTAGTGSEVSHAAVLTDHVNQIKVSTLSPHLRPQLAIVDPELTLTCPPKATADSGIDALTHAIEAYLATRASDLNVAPGTLFAYEGKHPIGDLFAERAITLIGQHLVAPCGSRTISTPAREWPWRRRLRGWPSPTAASPWYMRWSTRWAGRCTARMARGTGCCCPSSCGSTFRNVSPNWLASRSCWANRPPVYRRILPRSGRAAVWSSSARKSASRPASATSAAKPSNYRSSPEKPLPSSV